MLDIHDLEKRWLKYKIKSYIPYGIIACSLITIFFIILILLKTPEDLQISPLLQKSKIEQAQIQEKQTPLKETKTQKPPVQATAVVQQVVKKVQNTSIIQQSEKSNYKMTIKPSLGFIRKMQNDTSAYYNDTTNYQVVTKKKQYSVQKKQTIFKEKSIAAETQEIDNAKAEKIQPDEEIKKINIKRRNTKDDIAEIIQRFKKNNNPALSLFIAKKYYELGDYKKSYNYALITNQINSDIEASWIIFTKSLVKLGKKNMAIKTLKTYIQNSHSNTAQLLLEEIQSGKFK